MKEAWQFIYFKESGRFYACERNVVVSEEAFRLWRPDARGEFFAEISRLNNQTFKTLPGLGYKFTDLALVVIPLENSDFGWPLMFKAGSLSKEALGEW